jgi:hypothetical protein
LEASGSGIIGLCEGDCIQLIEADAGFEEGLGVGE